MGSTGSFIKNITGAATSAVFQVDENKLTMSGVNGREIQPAHSGTVKSIWRRHALFTFWDIRLMKNCTKLCNEYMYCKWVQLQLLYDNIDIQFLIYEML